MAARKGIEIKIQTVATSFLITQESSVFEQKFRPTSFNFFFILLNSFRLPIVQGGSFTFFAPTFAIMSLPQWQCPEQPQGQLFIQ